MHKLIAFIPARGGSKSIKNKNIKPLCGRPMIYWVLDAAVGSRDIDKIYVSTDCVHIYKAVQQYNNTKVATVYRSPQTATDTASTESAMLEFALSHEFEFMLLIQTTSPLLKTGYLDKGISLIKQGFDSVLSVTRQKRFIWDEIAEAEVVPRNYDPLLRPLRQDFDGFLVENGAFYITSREALLQTGSRLSGKIGMVELPEETYYEVDEPADWDVVEHFLKKEQINRQPDFSKIKAVFTDCDGVLTDAGMYYSETGDELKKFNTRDGMGFELLRSKGIITGIISGEDTTLLRRRAEKLRVDEIHLGVKDKLAVLTGIVSKYGLDFSNIAYIGDDLNDIAVLERVGMPCCVADAVDEVRHVSRFITNVKGGYGAFREVADLVCQAKVDCCTY